MGQRPGLPVRRQGRRLLESVRRARLWAESDEGSGFPMAQRKSAAPLVGVVMGSESDWDTLKHAAAQLDADQRRGALALCHGKPLPR